MPILYLVLFSHFVIATPKKITIVLDPAGDARNPGRLIGDTFERTCTMYFANQLKKALEKKDKNIMILFTRLPGEYTNQIEKARFSNTCDVDLFCTINAVQCSNIKPQMHIYHYQPCPLSTFGNRLFVPFEHAHEVHNATTQLFANALCKQMQQHSRQCDAHAPLACALTSLKGLISPAISVEFGIKQANNLSHCIEPFADALYVSLMELI